MLFQSEPFTAVRLYGARVAGSKRLRRGSRVVLSPRYQRRSVNRKSTSASPRIDAGLPEATANRLPASIPSENKNSRGSLAVPASVCNNRRWAWAEPPPKITSSLRQMQTLSHLPQAFAEQRYAADKVSRAGPPCKKTHHAIILLHHPFPEVIFEQFLRLNFQRPYKRLVAYRSVSIGGSGGSRYFGSGPIAEVAREAVHYLQERRNAARETHFEAVATAYKADPPVQRSCDTLINLFCGQLYVGGFYQHKNSWRRRGKRRKA